MTQAADVNKRVIYKLETTFNTAPGATLGQILRNVDSDIELDKDTYTSNEKRDDFQDADFRHGIRKSGGTIKGELSPKTYADFIAAALRRDFAAVAAITGLSITIAAGSVVNGLQQYTITRSTGSWITDGVKVGDVGRLTAGTFNAANSNKNLFVVAETATVLTVVLFAGVAALVAEGPIASATFAVTGKKTYTPLSGFTDKSFAVEHWYSDVAQSELFTGLKVKTLDIGLPATGMATLDIGFAGAGGVVSNTSQYYTSPTGITSTGIAAAVNGLLFFNGSNLATCTGIKFKVDGGHSGDPVVGSNTMPAILPDKVAIEGEITAFFTDATLRDGFWNESEFSLAMVLTSDNTAASDFVGFTAPRIKLKGAKRSKSGNGFIVTAPFKALRNLTGGAGTTSEQTTLSIQDSAA